MPYKCIVTGCRSGYDHTKTDNNEKEKVQMHNSRPMKVDDSFG